MCGLFGYSTRRQQIDVAVARACRDTLEHRGPDQSGQWSDENVYIGHRRLSILDLSEAGRQPMLGGDPPVVIAVNGEIYNYRTLRADLGERFPFHSDSDSEVILHGYRAWGIEELLERIDGMFALVIYDSERQRLYLARDRAGIKPLYFASSGAELAWASELKALRQHLGQPEIDRTALYDFLTYLYIPSPKTLYEGVCKLEPGHFLAFDLGTGEIRRQRYWSLPVEIRPRPLEEIAEELREALGESVCEQMVSDVPVGFFLSGGIDSSAVVTEAARSSTGALATYTIGFEDDPASEVELARQTAAKAGTMHHEQILSASSAKRLMTQMAHWYDEPFADMSAIPTYLVSKFARETCTVALSGDGGDELFGGYHHYRKFNHFPRYRALGFLPEKARQLIGSVAHRVHAGPLFWSLDTRLAASDLELMTRLHGGLLSWEKAAWRSKWQIPVDYDDYWYFRRFLRTDLPRRTRFQYIDFHTYLHDDILTKVDRASMAVSLEVRVPFWARRVVELAFSIPEAQRYYQGGLKGILKHTYRGRIPDILFTQPKKGFGLPLKHWGPALFAGQTRQERILEMFGVF